MLLRTCITCISFTGGSDTHSEKHIHVSSPAGCMFFWVFFPKERKNTAVTTVGCTSEASQMKTSGQQVNCGLMSPEQTDPPAFSTRS